MSDEPSASRGSDPGADEAGEASRDSMEDVLAEALAEEDGHHGLEPEEGTPSVDGVDIRDALRAALKPPAEDISITRGVQRKLREDPELQGRYFVDGWSTARFPMETYLITSVLILVVVAVVYLLIRPYGM